MLASQPSLTTNDMTLRDLLDAYTASVACGPRYQESLRRTVSKATQYGFKTACQLDAGAVNKFLGDLPVSTTTKHNVRRELLTLWRWGYEQRLLDTPPNRVKRIPASRKPPQAWSRDELCRLLEAAEKDEKVVNVWFPGVRRKHVLSAWLSAGYETGLRFSDMLSLTDRNFQRDCIVTTARKTLKPTVRKISPYALEKCQWLLDQSPDGTLLSWVLPRRRAILLWRDFLKEQGVRGSSKWLRRSGATEIERLHPGMATHWLDHTDPALCKKHYIDSTLLSPPIGPPPLR